MNADLSNMIELNGERKPLVTALTVGALVMQENMTGMRLLVVINDVLVSKGDWENTVVRAGDKVEFMTAITGG